MSFFGVFNLYGSQPIRLLFKVNKRVIEPLLAFDYKFYSQL